LTFGILSWSLLLAAALALVLGGDFRNLGNVRIRAWWLLALAPALKIGLLASHAPASWWAQPLIFVLVAIGGAANWRLPGVSLIALGLVLNAAVIPANGGFMPSSTAADRLGASTQSNALSKPEDGTTPLAFLDDRIPFSPTHQALSLGDIAIMVGGVWLVVGLAQPTRVPRLAHAKDPW